MGAHRGANKKLSGRFVVAFAAADAPSAYCTEVACPKSEEPRTGNLFASDGRAGHRQRIGIVMFGSKWWKFAAAGVASILWLLGLVDQLHSPQMTAGYLALSAAIVAVAVA